MFTPSRLTLARKRRGLTAVGLGRRTGVTGQSISNYERGRQQPSPETLERIAEELGFPTSFFDQGDIDEIDVALVSFRARSKITATARDAVLSAARLALELNGVLETHFRLPLPDIPTLEHQTPEQAAEYVRARWGIGELQAAPNMVHLLEAHGVRVFSLPPEYSDVDAFSMWLRGTPFVFLNTMKTGERGRFDAAHELGHLVLHGASDTTDWTRDCEREANLFASAFLMTRASIQSRIRSNPTTDQIIRAKRYWSVAAAALAYRLGDLGILSEWSFRRVMIELGGMGYRKGEPSGIPRETSQLLEKVFRGLRGKGISPHTLARELHTTPAELTKYVFGLVITAVDDSVAPLNAPPAGPNAQDTAPKLRLVSSNVGHG
ncbi:XRE family transcriptional regulator [Micromonospora sp. NBC_00362]|uniref:helix-turn-helix domain-containing protein n=1 Tax=Micromonospora sp. NBC_00362 TaxID=2975975 RepID=UPI00224F17B5|nr:XRE family transcriptional regulator [Micromonospora sp. NBC_00362]MCX5119903.1 XRE family transcriptional regulator [Micromonospora sp. NBC_00362]